MATWDQGWHRRGRYGDGSQPGHKRVRLKSRLIAKAIAYHADNVTKTLLQCSGYGPLPGARESIDVDNRQRFVVRDRTGRYAEPCSSPRHCEGMVLSQSTEGLKSSEVKKVFNAMNICGNDVGSLACFVPSLHGLETETSAVFTQSNRRIRDWHKPLQSRSTRPQLEHRRVVAAIHYILHAEFDELR